MDSLRSVQNQGLMLTKVFLGGAPKCGTSAIFYALAGLPEVCASQPKETFFFIDPDSPLRNVDCNCLDHGMQAHDRFFSTSNRSARFWLDGTTHLLFQRKVVPELAQCGQNRYVFILRDPARRILSSFLYTRNNLCAINERLSFAAYVDALLNGSFAEIASLIESETSRYVLERELEYGDYAASLEFWLNYVSSDQLLVMAYDEIKSQPASAIGRILKFLDIQSHQRPTILRTENSTMGPRFRRLHRLVRSVATRAPRSVVRQRLGKLYRRVLSGTRRPNERDYSMELQRLSAHFAESQRALHSQFGILLQSES